MVGHALSDSAKRQKQRRIDNDKMNKALEAYKLEQAKTTGAKRGLRPIAKEFGVHHATLGHLAKGGVCMSTFNESKQKITPNEECILVGQILGEADRGFPPKLKNIGKMADAILKSRKGASCESVGLNWVDRFIARHRDRLQTHWSKPLDTAWARALNPAAVNHWFNKIVKEQYVDRGILPENTYGMDESGFPPEASQTQRVVGHRGTKTQHKQGTANRENVTAIVTICADGTVLRPTIIFKGKNFMKNWRQNNVSEASFAHSANGWTDGELALEWIVNDFDAQTKVKAAGNERALFMDGHSSHFTPELLRYAEGANIRILAYPPHCTHALQGLDVVCFARMKHAWNEEIEIFEALHDHGLRKEDFAGVFGHSLKKAFTEVTVKAAFRATGIVPFNLDIITPAQMKPSEPTSVKGSFPLPQPSPVRAVMAAFHNHTPTAFEIDHSHVPPPSSPQPTSTPSSMELTHSPLRPHDPNLDPALFTPSKRHQSSHPDPDTPSKRMRLLTSSLASTASGSILVSKSMISSTHLITQLVLEAPPAIAEPDWSLSRPVFQTWKTREMLEKENAELTNALQLAEQHVQARDRMLEGTHAHLVVQHMHLDKFSMALKGKENKAAKKTDRSKLFPGGLGRHMTDATFIKALEDDKAKRSMEAASKSLRKATRASKKDERPVLEAQWKEMQITHQAAIKLWTAEVARLTEIGTRKKDLPPKPKCPLKPKAAVVAEPSSKGEGKKSGSEDESDSSDEL